MTGYDFIIITMCATLAVCPPRFDPAIRLKDWALRRVKRARGL